MRPVRPIPVNPGGRLDPEHIVGREAVERDVLAALRTRSVVITGERRLGKTSLARLIEANAPQRGWTVVMQSAEGFGGLDELAEALMSRFDALGGSLARAARSIGERAKLNLGPVEVDLNGSARAFEDVVAGAVRATDGRLLLILDELPLFARSLNGGDMAGGRGTAALHLLRRIRESHPGMRMLCLGSVGFHHVVRDAAGVLNDTHRLRLQPLGPDDARYLARCLLQGTSVRVSNERVVAEAIVAEVGGVPYYVHKLVESAEKRGAQLRLDAAVVRQIVADALSASGEDPWNLRHYRDRIGGYYGEDAPLARATLDAVAADGVPVTLDEIRRRVGGNADVGAVDGDRLREVLERLEDDHYLVREAGCRRFAFDLVRRAWVELRR